MKKQKVSASALPRRKVIKASKSTADMLNAFEDKLAEFGIESSTEIKGSEDAETYGEDYHEENVEASIRNSIELDDIQEERLWEIAERYNTSDPVSGDWDTEVEHERQAIADELGLTLREAQMVMMDELGFTRDQFDLK